MHGSSESRLARTHFDHSKIQTMAGGPLAGQEGAHRNSASSVLWSACRSRSEVVSECVSELRWDLKLLYASACVSSRSAAPIVASATVHLSAAGSHVRVGKRWALRLLA